MKNIKRTNFEIDILKFFFLPGCSFSPLAFPRFCDRLFGRGVFFILSGYFFTQFLASRSIIIGIPNFSEFQAFVFF